MGFRKTHLASFRRAYCADQIPQWRLNHQLCPIPRFPIVVPLPEHQGYALISRRWHGSHSHGSHLHHHISEGRGMSEGIFRLGLAADVALSVGKAITGYICGSTAIIADAAHSASDVVLSSIALLSYRVAKAPKDKEHPYGHGKFESLGALGISCMLLGTGGGIAWHAFDVLHGLLTSTPDIIINTLDPDHNHNNGGHHHGLVLDHPVLALSMTILSISVKEGLYWITKRAGENQGSSLMKANAWHHHTDAMSSVVALVGVGGSLLGKPFIDPLAGILVAGMICKAGIGTGYQSAMELVDAGVSFKELAPIKDTITQIEDVVGCHRLRGRRAGSFLYLDVHIECSTMLNQRKDLKNFEFQNSNISNQQEVEAVVLHVISSLFQEKMKVEHITLHKILGDVSLQVQVSMPPEMTIQDAVKMASEAEKEILKASSSINQVSIQLRLGHPILGHLGKNYQQDAETPKQIV